MLSKVNNSCGVYALGLLGINMFWVLIRVHFNAPLAAQAKMRLSQAQNIFM